MSTDLYKNKTVRWGDGKPQENTETLNWIFAISFTVFLASFFVGWSLPYKAGWQWYEYVMITISIISGLTACIANHIETKRSIRNFRRTADDGLTVLDNAIDYAKKHKL